MEVEALGSHGVMPGVRSVVDRVYAKELPETSEAIGIKVILGLACFLDGHILRVEGETLSSHAFVIATGTGPLIPKIPGLEKVPFLINENLHELENLPGSLPDTTVRGGRIGVRLRILQPRAGAEGGGEGAPLFV